MHHQQLDTTIEKNAHLHGKATTAFVSLVGGLRVVPFNLHPTLRVQTVVDERSQPLSFIQEDKDEDANFWVILPRPLALGEKYSITTLYEGKDVAYKEEGGNYYPAAREGWYPITPAARGRVRQLRHDLPHSQGMRMAATRVLVSDTTAARQDVSVWKSAVPQP